MSLPTRYSGFTLIEILLVLTILGVFSGMLMLTAPNNHARLLEADVKGFQSILVQTRAAATRNSEHYGISLSGDEWQLLRYGAAQSGRNTWMSVAWDDIGSTHDSHRWSVDTLASISQEKSSRTRSTANLGILRPDVLVYANGEMNTFTMDISAKNDKTMRYRFQSDGLNLNRMKD
ncbi:MAG: type II secretion system protein [Pseudomonadota bacterium]